MLNRISKTKRLKYADDASNQLVQMTSHKMKK